MCDLKRTDDILSLSGLGIVYAYAGKKDAPTIWNFSLQVAAIAATNLHQIWPKTSCIHHMPRRVLEVRIKWYSDGSRITKKGTWQLRLE